MITFKQFLEEVETGKRLIKRRKPKLSNYGAIQSNINVNHQTNDGGMSGPSGVSNAEYYK